MEYQILKTKDYQRQKQSMAQAGNNKGYVSAFLKALSIKAGKNAVQRLLLCVNASKNIASIERNQLGKNGNSSLSWRANNNFGDSVIAKIKKGVSNSMSLLSFPEFDEIENLVQKRNDKLKVKKAG